MTHDALYTLAAHLTLFLTTIAGFVFAWLREGRRHRWQQEQFNQIKTEVKNGHGK